MGLTMLARCRSRAPQEVSPIHLLAEALKGTDRHSTYIFQPGGPPPKGGQPSGGNHDTDGLAHAGPEVVSRLGGDKLAKVCARGDLTEVPAS